MAVPGRFIDKLKKAANLVPKKRVVVLSNGEEVEFYSKPLTMNERERAQKEAKSDDAGAFALQLLVNKATNGHGTRLFTPGDISELKMHVRDEDLQKLMLAVLQEPEDEEEVDMKSSGEGDKE